MDLQKSLPIHDLFPPKFYPVVISHNPEDLLIPPEIPIHVIK